MKQLFLIVLSLLCITSQAHATIFTLDMGQAFTGTNPSGPAPWLSATFNDEVRPGNVQLTMNNNLKGSNEFVSAWYFNLKPQLNPNNLNFTFLNGNDADIIQKNLNGLSTKGSGNYDFGFRWTEANPSDRFIGSQTSVYSIGGIIGLTADDFKFSSLPQGDDKTLQTAAHVQGIESEFGGNGNGNGSTSGPAPVPEPGTLLLLGSGLLGLAMRKKLWA